jgi:pyocin large subunit-like protein
MGDVWALDLAKPLKFLLLALADHADHNGRNAYPGVDLLAWKTGDNRRTVQRNLRKLEDLGLIVADWAPTGGRGLATRYTIQTVNGVKLSPFRDGEEGG